MMQGILHYVNQREPRPDVLQLELPVRKGGSCEYCDGHHNAILCRDISVTSRKALNEKLDKMLTNGQIKNLEGNYDPQPKEPSEYQDSDEEYI
uniref:Reverse transcriptase domain-containing protein n=1 Tax=Bursaphelenchus xylophilus TaxID=6326 RepID=A0A1I7S2Q4_BURXY